MNKERLDWVMSGLNRYKLTQKEDQFIKSTEEDFNLKNMITEQQEEKLENLYKESQGSCPIKTTSLRRKASRENQGAKALSAIHPLMTFCPLNRSVVSLPQNQRR